MNIYTVNEHLDMQENKLNAKYHLHVTLNRCNNTKAIASRLQDPTRAQEYLRKCKILTKSTKLHKQRYKII